MGMLLQQYLHQFPSPYWGYFFIKNKMYYIYVSGALEFPSPHWGLFFIVNSTNETEYSVALFPSPYWGLFFYHVQDSLVMKLT